MNKDEKNKKTSELDYIYSQAEREGGELQTDNLLMNPKDMGSVARDIDYKIEMQDSLVESIGVINNMSELYLSESETILNNKYIKNKVLTDANNLADMLFLQKIAKRAIIKQMEQIDSGEGSPRHYETLYNGMKEIRENIKQSTVTTSTMEGFYKQIREDLGLEKRINDVDGEENTQTKSVTNQRDLNDKLDQILKKKNS